MKERKAISHIKSENQHELSEWQDATLTVCLSGEDTRKPLTFLFKGFITHGPPIILLFLFL